jgi:Inosine-uridine preferring nucleoside hydrolase
MLTRLRGLWHTLDLATRPVHPELEAALARRWEGLPPHVKTPAQALGRRTTGCEGTHSVFPRCNLACTPCYHSPRREQGPHGRGPHGGRGRAPDSLPPPTTRPGAARPAHRRRGESALSRRPRRLPAGDASGGPILAGAARPLGRGDSLSEASQFLLAGPGPWRIVALGPLTNLPAAIEARSDVVERIEEVIAVGGNRASRGRWPPVWPYEFNLTADRRATRVVIESGVPLTLVSLEVARRLVVTPADLAALPGSLGEHLRSHVARWFRRALLLRGRRAFPAWDLVAALFVVDPASCETERTVACLHRSGWLEFGAGTRPVTLVSGFDPCALRRHFVRLARAELPPAWTSP